MKKKIPAFKTDQQAQDFVDTTSLTEYDFSGGIPIQFEFEAKAAHINMRVPRPLLDAVKERARVRGIPYTRFIRQLIEREVSGRENHISERVF
jgi:predicted DNA binding CopG/RHH family protein